MNKTLPIAVFVSCVSIFGCSNNSCDNWFEGAYCEIQERNKYCGTYLGEWKEYNEMGDLMESKASELVIIRSFSGINELCDPIEEIDFVLTEPGLPHFQISSFSIPIIANGSQQIWEFSGEGDFNGKTVFFELNSLNGASSLTFFGSK